MGEPVKFVICQSPGLTSVKFVICQSPGLTPVDVWTPGPVKISVAL